MNFTVDWFSEHIPTWERLVLPRSVKRYLEIGVHEGRSLCWMLDMIPSLYAVGIGIDVDDSGAFERCKENVGGRAKLIKASSKAILPTMAEQFDCIYIDGSHWAKDVLFDTVLAWPLLKSKGVMIWDDYGWLIDQEEIKRPKPAIDAFLTCYRGEYKVLHIGYQFIVEKV